MKGIIDGKKKISARLIGEVPHFVEVVSVAGVEDILYGYAAFEILYLKAPRYIQKEIPVWCIHKIEDL